MGDVYKTREKIERKKRLFDIGLETLKAQGYAIEKVPGSGKSSMRRIVKGRESMKVAIRTSQDRWLSFPRLPENGDWRTLSEVDLVVAVSVNDRENPTHGVVHFLEQADVLARFNRAYEARLEAGRNDPGDHGVWISLYDEERDDPVSFVGAGAARGKQEMARVPLVLVQAGVAVADSSLTAGPAAADQRPLTIAQAKQGLALTFGVDPSHIKITVEA